MDRREFLRRSKAAGLGVAAGLSVLADARSARATPANERIVLAVVGVRSRGQLLATELAQRPDCRIAYLCDADTALLGPRAEIVAKVQGGRAPTCVGDFRKALEDQSVDALVIATPDHWHCLAALWACQAGKDVYVAAPLSHNAWEGRRLVEVARKHQRIVDVDLAARSVSYAQTAKQYLMEGKLGKIHLCRVFAQKGQSNFPQKPDSPPPAGLDWDAWNGPAPEAAYNVNYQNNWHGFWRFSGGEIAVDGIHQLDLARWLCGLEYPSSVYAVGGRFDTQGANETPDTLVATYQFEKLLMTFEMTLYTPYMLKVSPAVRNGDLFPYWPQHAARIEIYGTEGVMLIGPHGTGWQVYARPRREQPTIVDRTYGRLPDPEHHDDFVQSIRKRKVPNADIEEAHRSGLLVHYANMSLRTGGRKLAVDPRTEGVDDMDAMKLFRRQYRPPWVVE
ncbi:MAG: Gfo/Idh/MocA family oxidoreductase [Thermoguttaceae bacterium]